MELFMQKKKDSLQDPKYVGATYHLIGYLEI